jgi:translation initiation factor 2 beta subunit (eIF-2beta)/eIF-5
MKKKDIIDLITAHYEDDPRLFFHRTIEILKEFQEDGDKELVEYVSNILKSKVKIARKREVTKLEDLHEEISFDDATYLDWVPMLEPQDYKVCPKCGSHNIEANKDISNPFIRCKDCGYYLREGKSHE